MKKLWKVMSVLLCGAMLLTGCGNTKVAQNSGTIEEKKDSVYTTFSDIKNSGCIFRFMRPICTVI